MTPPRNGPRHVYLAAMIMWSLSQASCEKPYAAEPVLANSDTTSVLLRHSKLQVLDGVASSLATAFRGSANRRLLYSAVQNAPGREGKLYLWDVLSQPESGLGRVLAEALETRGVSDWSLRQVPALEFYFPVDEHRDAWTGGGDLLIGFQLHEWEPPTAVDLEGERHVLTLDRPPENPVLMVVPAERRATENAGLVSISTDDYPNGIYLRQLSVAEDGESWPRGDPEIELHLVAPQSASNFTTLATHECAHEASSHQHRRFDMNGTSWYSGDILVADSSDLADIESIFASAGQPDSARFIIEVWEDDTGTCEIVSTEDSWNDRVLAAVLTAGYVYGFVLVLDECQEGKKSVAACVTVLLLGPTGPFVIGHPATWWEQIIDAEDEFLGLISPRGGWGGFREGAITADVYVGTSEVGYAELEATPFRLRAEIAGPELVCSYGGTGPRPRYSAELYGGAGAIQYRWYEDGEVKGTSATHLLTDTSVGLHSLTLVVDRGSERVTKNLTVTVTESGHGCAV